MRHPYREDFAYWSSVTTVIAAILGLLAFLELRKNVHRFDGKQLESKPSILAGIFA